MKKAAILIVDDNPRMRRALREILSDLADRFHECSDGIEALAAYSKFQPDWALMDLKMKNLDGLTATAQIIAAFPQAKIVIVTNYDDERLREAARRAGACAYVTREDLMPIRSLIADEKHSTSMSSATPY
jgi:two-component system response regulator DegU